MHLQHNLLAGAVVGDRHPHHVVKILPEIDVAVLTEGQVALLHRNNPVDGQVKQPPVGFVPPEIVPPRIVLLQQPGVEHHPDLPGHEWLVSDLQHLLLAHEPVQVAQQVDVIQEGIALEQHHRGRLHRHFQRILKPQQSFLHPFKPGKSARPPQQRQGLEYDLLLAFADGLPHDRETGIGVSIISHAADQAADDGRAKSLVRLHVGQVVVQHGPRHARLHLVHQVADGIGAVSLLETLVVHQVSFVGIAVDRHTHRSWFPANIQNLSNYSRHAPPYL